VGSECQIHSTSLDVKSNSAICLQNTADILTPLTCGVAKGAEFAHGCRIFMDRVGWSGKGRSSASAARPADLTAGAIYA
jgi:hypothetical protein